MTKQELMENYTMEQLAEMVVKLQEKKSEDNQIDEVFFLSDIKPYASGAAIKRIIETGSFKRIHIITDETYNGIWDDKNKYEKLSDDREEEINQLKSQLDRKQTEIKQIDEQLQHYKFAMMQVDDVLVEFFGKTHEIMDKPHEFEKILQEVIDKSKTIYNFLPTEPIDVASMLINTKGECEPLKLCGQTYKGTYKLFDISKLRQIAEHLLVYCNANERARNEEYSGNDT